MTGSYPITFVCCVESGVLEPQTLRMIESLRRWGGRFANAPIFAVTPRFGPPLAYQTHQNFERLNVEYLRINPKSRYSWNKFMNKPYAVVAAEERSTSESICWLDSDLLILDEPNQLILKEREDFLACPVGKSIATTGPDDPQEPFWKEACQVVGINDIEQLPWITTARERKRIRLYWNSGVFVYRRSTGFARDFLQACIQLLDARLSNHQAGIFFTDQVALALAMVKNGMSWRCLPYSHNYGWSSQSYSKWHNEEQLKAAKIFHYHDSMYPHFWSTFIKCLLDTHPDVANWLLELGALKNEVQPYSRITNKVTQYFRSRQESTYIKSCRVV